MTLVKTEPKMFSFSLQNFFFTHCKKNFISKIEIIAFEVCCHHGTKIGLSVRARWRGWQYREWQVRLDVGAQWRSFIALIGGMATMIFIQRFITNLRHVMLKATNLTL